MLVLTSLITLPSSTEAIAGIGEWSSPWFEALLPWVYLAVGCIIAGVLIRFIINAVLSIFSSFTKDED